VNIYKFTSLALGPKGMNMECIHVAQGGNEISISIKGMEFLLPLSNYQHLKKDSDPWNLLHHLGQ
jgi:hypothetical protein